MAIQKEWNKAVADVLSALERAGSIVLLTHVSPDGDTLGSALALKLALEKKGKRVQVACSHKVPQVLLHMQGAQEICLPDGLREPFDLAVAIDVADLGRMGDCRSLFEGAKVNAQIDHHGTNPGYAQINLVNEKACATGEIIWEILRAMEVEVDRETAVCLYTAISTDTGNFSFDNTTGRAFEIMGSLLACGLPLNELNRRLFRLRPPQQAKLLGRALNSLTFYEEEKISGMLLSLKDFEACGALPEHAETIVNFGMDVTGVRMTFLGRETSDGQVKVSLRAQPPCNVARVAARFGGGGHALASGCTLDCSLQEAAQLLLGAMREEL